MNALDALNSAPVFTPIPAMTAEAGTNVTFFVDAVDKDGDALTYSSNSLPLGSFFRFANRSICLDAASTRRAMS